MLHFFYNILNIRVSKCSRGPLQQFGQLMRSYIDGVNVLLKLVQNIVTNLDGRMLIDTPNQFCTSLS